MTKTLTEQWREGTLPAGYYYIIANTKARNKVIFYLPKNTNTDGAVIKGEVVNGKDGGWVIEVLGPVPDYMDCKGLIYDSINLQDARKRIDELIEKIEQLEKKLEIATKALCKVSQLSLQDNVDISRFYDIAHYAITELNKELK